MRQRVAIFPTVQRKQSVVHMLHAYHQSSEYRVLKVLNTVSNTFFEYLNTIQIHFGKKYQYRYRILILSIR